MLQTSALCRFVLPSAVGCLALSFLNKKSGNQEGNLRTFWVVLLADKHPWITPSVGLRRLATSHPATQLQVKRMMASTAKCNGSLLHSAIESSSRAVFEVVLEAARRRLIPEQVFIGQLVGLLLCQAQLPDVIVFVTAMESTTFSLAWPCACVLF